MSIQDAAAAAVKYFPWVPVATPDGAYPLPVVMVAIAGGESGWRNNAQGDCNYYDAPRCNGCTSFGLWQIRTVHGDYLRRQTGSNDPCVWANWLFNPDNNARAAKALYDGAGLTPWTVWNKGTYRAYLGHAQAAVAAVKREKPGGEKPVPLLLWALAAGAVLLLSVAVSPSLRRKVEDLWRRKPKSALSPVPSASGPRRS